VSTNSLVVPASLTRNSSSDASLPAQKKNTAASLSAAAAGSTIERALRRLKHGRCLEGRNFRAEIE
jgi:hypothetical protein